MSQVTPLPPFQTAAQADPLAAAKASRAKAPLREGMAIAAEWPDNAFSLGVCAPMGEPIDWLKMLRVATSAIPANMVKFLTWRNWPSEHAVGYSVRTVVAAVRLHLAVPADRCRRGEYPTPRLNIAQHPP